MSKKKSFTGSTMTLKDFHGGSIPSDLPLPSAPGIAAPRPASSDQHRWAPPPASLIGSNSRTRPGSASARSLDDAPFLSTPPNIGRHFDEDERKPFDANAAFIRRVPPDPVVAPENISSTPITLTRSDPKPRPAVGPSAAGTPNAWGVRREKEAVVVSALAADPVVSSSGGSSSSSLAVLTSRFAQGSAIDKISSGRWQSKLVKAQQEVVDEEEEAKVVDLGERLKLKLLPRTRGGDASESRGLEEKQV